MSTDLAARLRLLVQDHRDGRLTLAEYRNLRAPLLDSLELRALTGTDDEAITRPRMTGRVPAPAPRGTAGSAQNPALSKKRIRAAVFVLGVLIIITVVAWTLRGRHSQGGAADQASESAESAPVYAVVRPFVERADWSDARVNALNASLLELGHGGVASAASEQWFEHFVDDVRRRFKEQQALSAAPLTADNSPLAALAVTVGLDLNAPDAAIHVTAPETTDSSVTSVPATLGSQAPAASPAVRAVTRDRSPQVHDASRENTMPPVEKGAAASLSVVSPTAAAPTTATASTVPAASAAVTPEPCRTQLIGSRRPLCHDVFSSGEAGPQLALIPSGAFDMGSDAVATEGPVHRVTLRKPFAIAVYEVSQAEFRLYCEHAGRSCASQPWSGDDYPEVNVSWNDAIGYVEWLSAVTGQHYRLPTESEWEYAARAGQAGLFPSGDSLSETDAWFALHDAPSRPAPRSQQFNHNAFRLYHMVGNVREWVDDAWSRSFAGAPTDGSARTSGQAGLHVARGGSYVDGASKLRLTTREGLPDTTRDSLTGFRIVRELP
jgi:formylglycine-generating enzyme required for sulfatase activity